MTTRFDRQLPGFRLAEIQVDDTMQAISARELGDASLWPELVEINDLLPPYVSSTASADGRVLAYGARIRIPTPLPVETQSTTDDVFLTDCRLDGGALVADASGDFMTIAGISNLTQAIKNALVTETGELMFHGDYGCDVGRLRGGKGTKNLSLLGGSYVRSTLMADARVRDVKSVSVSISGDALPIDVVLETVTGERLPITVADELPPLFDLATGRLLVPD